MLKRYIYNLQETRSVVASSREEADELIYDAYNLDYETWDQDFMFVGDEEAFPGLDKLLNGPSIFDEPDDGSKQIREFTDKKGLLMGSAFLGIAVFGIVYLILGIRE